MRVVGIIVSVWLIIGVVAVLQRGYLFGGEASCAKAGTIAVTVIAGALNYVGANPKIKCDFPEPSK